MGRVGSSATMSLDGYIAFDDNTIGALFDWYEAGDVEVTTATPDLTFRVTPQSARESAYLNDLANPRALAWMAGGAAIERFRSGDRVDFQDELAYRATKRMVGISVRHGLAAAMHLGTDTRYHRCD